MSVRFTETSLTTTNQANKIPVLTDHTTLGALDGSQLTNLNLTVPANSRAVSFGEVVDGAQVPGNNNDGITRNKVYYGTGLFEAAHGLYLATNLTTTGTQPGDAFLLMMFDDGQPRFAVDANNVSKATFTSISGKHLTTTTNETLSIEKGVMLPWRMHVHPLTGFTHIHPSQYVIRSINDFADVDTGIGPSGSLATAQTDAKHTLRFDPVLEKWTQALHVATKDIDVTDVTIMNTISYDRFFETGVRETDNSGYFRIKNIQNIEQDGSFDNLHIFIRASNLTVNAAVVPITELKVVLPNINAFWSQKTISIFCDNPEITVRVILEKDTTEVDNTVFIENANYTTTPTVANIANLVCNTNQSFAYKPALRFLACDSSFMAFPDAPVGTKSWIII